jgi:hypothetical protein
VSRRRSVRTLLVALVVAAVAALAQQIAGRPGPGKAPVPSPSAPRPSPPRPDGAAAPAGFGGRDAVIAAARDRRSNVLVEVDGRVVKVLQDDREGDPHERFLLLVADGLTLLVAHNLELAERVPLKRGDRVTVRGEYEWNEKGGVLHWTHDDPAGRHPAGFILHEGRTYQ